MTVDGDAARGFAAVSVVRDSLAITYGNLFRFPALVLAIGVPGVVLTTLARMVLASGVRPTATGSAIDFGSNAQAILFVLVASIIAMLCYLLIQAAIVVGTLQSLRGGRAAIGFCLGQAIAALPRLLLAGLVLFVGGGVAAGIVGFIAAAIFGAGTGTGTGNIEEAAQLSVTIVALAILAVALVIITLAWVFVPAIVAERLGPIAGLRRSLQLTRGRRWPIFAIILAISLANVLTSALTRWLIENGAPLGGAVLNLLVALFFLILTAVLAAVGYARLRAEKEGGTPEDVMRVFD